MEGKKHISCDFDIKKMVVGLGIIIQIEVEPSKIQRQMNMNNRRINWWRTLT